MVAAAIQGSLLSGMSSESSSIPTAADGPTPVGQARPRERSPRGETAFGNQVARRYFVDPNDVEAAIDRLTQLLATDTAGPRMDVPPGFYLNILV